MEESLSWQGLTREKNIEIKIDCIENIIGRDGITISFIVEHNNNILGESSSLTIEPNFDEPSPVYDIDYVVNLPIIIEDRASIESIVSTPILIKAVHSTENEKDGSSTVSNIETRKKSKFTTKATTSMITREMGVCNIDLMPILMGEKYFTEKVVLETPQFSFDGASVTWKNLPFLTVTIMQDDLPLFPDEKVNFLNITVESIYYLPGFLTDNFEYKAGTIAYGDTETAENIFFENGKWINYRDIERTKRWNSLHSLESRARLSKYKLDCDFMGVKNEFKKEFDLAKTVCEDNPRIEWNSINRSILWRTGAEAMQSHITRYKYWPFQFTLTEKSPESKSKDKSAIKPHDQLYSCYADLSELLFPGKQSTRVVAQLRTYNPSDITEKTGLENNIFILDRQVKEPRDKDKRSKTSKQTQSIPSPIELPPSVELISENGQPTIIIIEIELYQPLIPCRNAEDFTDLLNDLIPQKDEKQHFYAYSGDVAQEQYENCVQKLAEVITESYRYLEYLDLHYTSYRIHRILRQDFREKKNEEASSHKNADSDEDEIEAKRRQKYCYDPESDELTCFTQYLYRTDVYLSLRSTLRSKVTMLLDQRFKMPPNFVDSSQTQNFIAAIYTYLVEHMHMAINKIVESRNAANLSHTVNSEKLYLYAEEAYELGHHEDARHYYTTAIASNKQSVEPWIRYAIFLLKTRDIDRARECCLEAITLNRQHKIALLIYGSILFGNREYREAEIFFRTITDLYPRFTEGWIILHLLYIRTEYYPGIELTSRIAEKCMKSPTREIEIFQEPFCWSKIDCPQPSIYTTIIIYLLQLHLCEFAEIALAQEMLTAGRSTHILYYMAVEHYLSGRYEDAILHLREIQFNHGMDYYNSSLMGHCHFQIGDFVKAMECYEFARMLFIRPDNLHLVEVRMGIRYNATGEYQRAKKVFLSACKSSPTAYTWFGAGISFYELKELKEAEAALSEANRIDNRNADIWGYLCLLNITLEKYDEFAQCYGEMVKNNLKNRKLWLIITQSMEALGYTPPILTVKDDIIVQNYEDESEEQFVYDDDT